MLRVLPKMPDEFKFSQMRSVPRTKKFVLAHLLDKFQDVYILDEDVGFGEEVG